jgi:hypothetical protein
VRRVAFLGRDLGLEGAEVVGIEDARVDERFAEGAGHAATVRAEHEEGDDGASVVVVIESDAEHAEEVAQVVGVRRASGVSGDLAVGGEKQAGA